MIDDIYITESPINDIEVSNGLYGFDGYQYTRIPQSQIQPMDFSIQSINTGSANQTGTNFTVDIQEGGGSIFNDNSNDTTINSLSTDTFKLNNLWTPQMFPLNTPYTVTLNIFSDSLDETPNNNEITLPSFQTTDQLWALDDFSTNPGNGGGTPGPNNVTEYEAGNYFKTYDQADLMSIDIVTGSNTPIGTFIDAVIYEVDYSSAPETYTEVWRSQLYSITALDIGVTHYFYDIIGSPIALLTAGKTYFAAAHSYVDYEFGTSGISPPPATSNPVHSAIRFPTMTNPNASSAFYLIETPMIRLMIDHGISVKELSKTEFSISPNPTSGKFTITLDSEEQETYTLSVKNVIGQTLLNKELTIGSVLSEEILLEDYKKGIYFVSLTNKKGTKTTKLIVE